ncbi:nucleotidyltransferase-like protein, partial [Anoxybacillus flavithermus]
YKPNREIFHHIHLLDEESSTSFSLIVSTVCIHCKDVLSRIQGKILFERNEYIGQLRQRLLQFPEEERKVKMGIEFAKLVRRYIEGRSFFEKDQWLDAYNHVLHALHHLARLSIIEHGFYPEVTVWNQVKQIEPQIYKLYAELVGSEEPLDKRLQLLFLASDFFIHSKLKQGVSHLIHVLEKREASWSMADLLNEKELEVYGVDLEILLEFLVVKHLISVKKIATKGQGVFHRHYVVEKK